MALTAVEEAQLRDLIAQQSALLSLAGVEATILSKLGATKVTLSDLVAAISVADTDLLLARQGTTDKSMTAALLASYVLADIDLTPYAPLLSPTFTGDPKAPTPAVTDNDTSLATTAFTRALLAKYGLGTSDVVDYAGDVNALTEGGIYLVATGANTPTVDPYFIIVASNAGNNTVQLAIKQGTNSLYVRTSSAGVWAAWTNLINVAATDTIAGIIELATNAEVIAGTDAVRAVTPASMKAGLNASGIAPVYACRAWVNFNGTGTVAIKASGNVTSITDGGAGIYTVNFTTAMQDANYGTIVTCTKQGGPSTESGGPKATQGSAPDLKTTTQVQLIFNDANGNKDLADISVSIFR